MARKKGIGSVGRLKNRKYYKHNYIEVINSLVPDLYSDTDFSIYGTEEDIQYTVLGKILKAVEDIKTLFNVSATEASAIRQHFILRNNKTNVRPFILEQKILKPLNTSFDAFPNRTDFKNFVSSTLLPNIHLNTPTTTYQEGIEEYVDSTVSTLPLAHTYLKDNLSWLYFLNTSGPSGGFDPSAGVTSAMMQIYDNKTFTEEDGVSLLFEYFWRNRETNTALADYIPPILGRVNTAVSGDTYASGTQQLDSLKTLVKIWYDEADETSTTLDTYLDLYLNTGAFAPKQVAGGAFTKFLQAVSFGFYDVNTTIEELGDLVDIERCPPQFLQYLATLIGWQLMTGDVDRWRAQLRKAVYLYKSKGTKRCLEDAIDLVFPGDKIDVVKNMKETWECFLPRMIYYLIATESAVLADPSYGPGTLRGIPNSHYSSDNHDLNYRFATDYVLKQLHKLTPPTTVTPEGGCIYYSGKKFDLATWEEGNPTFNGFAHRGVEGVPVPPWENDRFYDNTYFTSAQIDILEDLLKGKRDAETGFAADGGGLEIPATYVDSLLDILKKQTYADNSIYQLNWNDKWKFYTSSMEVPPNLASVIASGEGAKLNLIDFWSSKSSLVHSEIDLNNLSHDIEGVGIDVPTIMANINSVFKQFAPFHVVIKIFASTSLTDTYNQLSDIFVEDGVCIRIFKNELNFENLGHGFQADSDQFIFNNVVNSTITVSSVAGVPTKVSHANTPRASGRRRNFKYDNSPHFYSRNGNGMPIPTAFVNASAVEPSSISNLKAHSREFIPLGFNFSSGDFYSTSGDFSGVYDASNELAMSAMEIKYEGGTEVPGTEYYLPNGRGGIEQTNAVFNQIAVSSTFPCRAPFGNPCDVVISRNEMPAIKRIIINKLIQRGETDSFDDYALDSFAFGSPFHASYFDYISYFNKQFKLLKIAEYVDDKYHVERNYGGRYLAAHIFGPLLENHNFTFAGRLNLKEIETNSAYNTDTTNKLSFYPHWKYIFNNPSTDGDRYTSASGIEYTLSASLFNSILDIPTESYRDDVKYLHTSGQLYRACRTALDNVELVGRASQGSKSFVVVNEVSSVYTSDDKVSDGKGSVSLYNNDFSITDLDESACVRFPLDGNRSYIKNGEFKYTPSVSGDEYGTNYTSSVAGWQLIDSTKTPTAYSVGAENGSIVVSAVEGHGDRKTNWIAATASGPGAAGNSDSCILRTGHKGVRVIKGLIPERLYTLAITHKSLEADCSGIRYNLKNLSAAARGEISDWNGTTWISAASASVPNITTTTTMTTTKNDITVSSGFFPSDEYQLDLYFAGKGTNELCVSYVSAISLVESNSSQPNSLIPDRSYDMTIRARTNYPVSNSLGVRIYTDPIPELDYTDYADRDLHQFFYNFSKNSWNNLNKSNNSWNIIPMRDFDIERDSDGVPTGWVTINLNFSTRNRNTNYDKSNSIFIRHGKEPHNDNTAYYVEFANATPSEQIDNYITIDSVSMRDTTYTAVRNEYDFKEMDVVFKHFDLLAGGKQSRNYNLTYEVFGTNGGSRGTYIEGFGGHDHLGTNDNLHPYGSGVLYDLDDD